MATKNVPDYIKTDLANICSQHPEIFAFEEDTMTVNHFYTQNITLKDKEPVYIKNYRIPHTKKEEINRQVNLFLQNKLVEPSTSNYNGPVLIAPKKD